jgi:hypothetical protein
VGVHGEADPHGGLNVDTGGVRVEGLRELVRDLEKVGVEVADLKGAFADIAAKGATLAASLAPHRSGALAASVRGNRAKAKAVVAAGSARVKYAGAINYGWRARNIEASGFMQRADLGMRETAVTDLDRAVTRLLAQRGMS